IRLAVLDIPVSSQAQLCIRSGYLALREVAGFFGFDYDDSPAPDDPISVARDEFDELYDKLVAAGLPVRLDRDQAWRDFAGWRVEVAVQEEGRRRVGSHAEEGRRVPEYVGRLGELPLHDPTLEERLQADVAQHGPRPVEDAVERDHRPHRRVDALEPRLELRIV